MIPAVPLSRLLARGLSVAASALLAGWVVESGSLWPGTWGLALGVALQFMVLDWALIRPRHRVAERLATGIGQLLLGLGVLACLAGLFGYSLLVSWSLGWLLLASVMLALLELGNDRVAAWRPGVPRVVLAGACPHVSPFTEQLGQAAVRLSREDALGLLTQQPTLQLSERVVIFDTCLHATPPQCVQDGCPTLPVREVHAFSSGAAAAKRLFDLLGATVLLSACAPLLVVIALIVRLQDGGPALFRQQRLGLQGSIITVLKFRSMGVAAGSDLLAPQACLDDPRVTPLGKWMRHWGIDELPQLINVLRGDMSLVGPRPHAVAHDLHYGAKVYGYTARQAARPGITGLAQIRGRRGETRAVSDMASRVRDDLEYIARQSLWLDLFILLATPIALLRSGHGRCDPERITVPAPSRDEQAATPSEDSRYADSKAESV
ncbi:sugar transferase [Pseudomonas extremaustralis]|uniref:Sugar transferase involved in LPS biosynthesis (Colanic, teichoic acid) n=2 Tax=Pseudomonas extremaustralis TaxID=359110 RepID=A0ABY0NYC1_9PSED|nr:sugar transferase [Pseudomonas extremaustralis]MDF3132814.1 sugar transferase [Pseudomonas extremaustralis]SDG30123.1 Sugar transferase involved in LPS biosynthesis (colanic, teichoic acid) [Pseudomonas extremaustralis]